VGDPTTPVLQPQGRFSRRDRLGGQTDFQRVMRKGRRTQGPHLGLAVARTLGAKKRIGLAISKGVGNAPDRARMRRLTREAFRAVRHTLPTGTDVVVFVRRPWPDADLASVLTELTSTLRQLRLGGS
jgi:ribonuclease P protein component